MQNVANEIQYLKPLACSLLNASKFSGDGFRNMPKPKGNL